MIFRFPRISINWQRTERSYSWFKGLTSLSDDVIDIYISWNLIKLLHPVRDQSCFNAIFHFGLLFSEFALLSSVESSLQLWKWNFLLCLFHTVCITAINYLLQIIEILIVPLVRVTKFCDIPVICNVYAQRSCLDLDDQAKEQMITN